MRERVPPKYARHNTRKKPRREKSKEIKMDLRFWLMSQKIRIGNLCCSPGLFYGWPLAAKVIYSMAAPGSFFAVLMVKAVLTELTFGVAVSSRIMKF